MGKTILIVDDEVAMRTLLELMLKKEGYQFLHASDAYEALQLIDEQIPDLVITDVMMPGMTGIDLVREMRHRSEMAKTPIFVLTADSDPSRREEGEQAGADRFLAKPVMKVELLNHVHAFLL